MLIYVAQIETRWKTISYITDKIESWLYDCNYFLIKTKMEKIDYVLITGD